MGSMDITEGSYSAHVIAQAGSWPRVRTVRASCGVGMALTVDGREIVHFHGEGEAELRLTRPVVARLHGPWVESGRPGMEPRSDWVSVRLDSSNDVALVVSLVSVAIKAAAPPRPQGLSTVWKPGCSIATACSR
jgi:hypothetical protein